MLKSVLSMGMGVIVSCTLMSASASVMADDGVSRYQELASQLGLEYGHEYSYREWRLEVLDQFQSWQPGVGDCGTWADPKECERQPGYVGLDVLYCSHGRDVTSNCDMRGDGPFLETVYLTERDITLLTKMQHDKDGVHTKVTLLKLAKGRQPDLHKS